MKLEPFLAKFHGEDVETETTRYLTRVPALGEFAYLNLIFKPAPESLQRQVAEDLRMPDSLVAFYRSYNGVNLFNNSFAIYGMVKPGQLFDRENFYFSLPYNIIETNATLQDELGPRDLICFASYVYYGSKVCMRREDEKIICYVEDDFSRIRCQWDGFEHWLTSELVRLSALHDEQGHLLADETATLPGVVQ